MKKSLISLLALLLAVTILAVGCAGQATTPTTAGTTAGTTASQATTTAAAEPVNLTIMWWGSDTRHEATNKALAAYTAANPEITFTPEYTDWDGYWTKLPTLAATKSMPDVMQMDASFIKDYVKRGTLADLSDIDLKGTVADKILENIALDGKIYGVPLSLNAQGMAYNKSALADAGIAAPKNNWTYDDYWAFALECRQKLPADKWGIHYPVNNWEDYQFYQTANGKGPVFSNDGMSYNIDKTLWIDFHNKYLAYVKDNVLAPVEVQLDFEENDPARDPVGSGKVMLRRCVLGGLSALEDLMPGNIGVVNMPLGSAGGGWAQATIFFSSAATSKNLDQAKAFMKWFVSSQDAGKILGMVRGMPVSAEIFKSLESTMTPANLLGKQMLDICVVNALPFYPAAAGWSDFVGGYKSELEKLMFNQQTVEETYDKIIEMSERIKAKVATGQ